jgi:hypothetical protein
MWGGQEVEIKIQKVRLQLKSAMLHRQDHLQGDIEIDTVVPLFCHSTAARLRSRQSSKRRSGCVRWLLRTAP